MNVSWRVSVCPSGTGLGNVHFWKMYIVVWWMSGRDRRYGIFSKTYITQLCARRAQRNPFNLQSSPKCWHDISNPNIYIPLTHTPQIVGNTYPIQMSYFRNVHYPTLCPKGTKKPLQFTIIPQVLA